MIAWLALLALPVLADEGGEDVFAGPPPLADVPVIVVEGHRVADARDQLLRDLAAQGYDHVRDEGDYLILRADDPYKGRIFVYDDGWVTMRVPKTLQVTKPAFAGVGVAGGFNFFPTHGSIAAIEEYALEPSRRAMEAYGDRVADAAIDERVNALPAQLDALWTRGVPLRAGEPLLVSVADRKAAILDYWESRTDTIWGDRVREAVETFLRAEVQASDERFTEDEIRAFNAGRQCERDLELDRTREP